MKRTYRILIADDHEHAREGIREILKPHAEFDIVAEATNGQEALEMTARYMPDLILMDIQMPQMDGLEATRLIKIKYPYVKVVIITVSDQITDLFEALKKGAQGYLLKNLDPSTWYDYVKAFAMDETPMSKELAVRILKEFTERSIGTNRAQEGTTPLSAREKEVLTLVAKGFTNKAISTELHISEYTVKNHLKNIMQKLHLDNRVQLTGYAYQKGWVQ
jgi:DNA-binding NarL/FixJ family response regulator